MILKLNTAILKLNTAIIKLHTAIPNLHTAIPGFQSAKINYHAGRTSKFVSLVAAVLLIASVPGNQPMVLAIDLKPIHSLVHQSNVFAVAFTKNQKELISVGTKRTVTIRRWDLAKGKLLSEVILDSPTHGNLFMSSGFAISPNAKLIAASDKAGFGLWSVETGKRLATLSTEHNANVAKFYFSNDSRHVFAAELSSLGLRLRADVSAVRWDISDVHNHVQMGGQELPDDKPFSVEPNATFVHTGALQIHSVKISDNGKFVATTSQENGTAIFDSKTSDLISIISNDNSKKTHPKIKEMSASVANQVLSASFSPGGKLFATTDMLGLKIKRTADGSLLHDIDKPFRYGRSNCVFSPDGAMVARYSTDSLLTIWDVKSGKELHSIKTEAHHAAFSNDGKRIAVGLSDKIAGVKVFELKK